MPSRGVTGGGEVKQLVAIAFNRYLKNNSSNVFYLTEIL
jgi:hypothetical protein